MGKRRFRVLGAPFDCVPPVVGLIALATCVLLFWVAPAAYHRLLVAAFRTPTPRPFVDLDYLFNTVRCWQRGVDVYVANPCDPLGRVMVYSPLLLRVSVLAVPASYAQGAGLALAAAFFVSLGWLAGAAPRARWVLVLAAVSSLSVFALERGNIDLLIVLGALLAARLSLAGDRWLPLAAVVVFALAIVKFYPLLLSALFLRRASWSARACFVGVPLATVLALGLVWPELLHALANSPSSSLFGDMWGRRQLFVGLGPVLQAVLPAAATLALARIGCVALVLLPALYAAVRVPRDRALGAALAELPALADAALYAGAVVMAGCFAMTDNVGYRGVFFILALPGLAQLSRQAVCRPLRALPVVILVLMFKLTIFQLLRSVHLAPEDGLVGRLVWLAFESGWWFVFAALASLVLLMTLRADGVQSAIMHMRINRNIAS